MLARAAKAASGFLSRSGCAARLPLLAAMAGAAWAQFAWLWAWALGVGGPGNLVGILIVVWHFALVVAAVVAVCDQSDVVGGRRLVTGKAPLILWESLTQDGRVAVWMASLWILLWPAELLACLMVALWWLGSAFGAAMDLTICRKGHRGEKR